MAPSSFYIFGFNFMDMMFGLLCFVRLRVLKLDPNLERVKRSNIMSLWSLRSETNDFKKAGDFPLNRGKRRLTESFINLMFNKT